MEQYDDEPVSITGGPLRPHEYVLVKPELDAADEAWIQNHSARLNGNQKNVKDMQITFTLGDVQLATLKRVIKGWNLSKTHRLPDGTTREIPLPFSTQNVERLPSKIYKYVLKKFAEMNPDDEEEEGEDGVDPFSLTVVDSSEDSFAAERVVRLKH